MNYDKMSVDEWLQTFFEAATCDGVAFAGNEEVGIDEIKRELCKAVIREASVGRVFFTTDKCPVAIGAKELKVGGRTFDLILSESDA